MLEHCVFSFNRWYIVKSFINGLYENRVSSILKVYKVKLYFHLLYILLIRCSSMDLLWLHFGDCYFADDCLRWVFGPRHAASGFRADCLTWSISPYFYFLWSPFLTCRSFSTNKRVHSLAFFVFFDVMY